MGRAFCRSIRAMLRKLSEVIDSIQEKFGFLTSLLIWPMFAVVIYEVIMRYVFDSPTIWGFETTTYIYGVHFMLGLGYTYLHDGHVKVDVIVTRMKPKLQLIISIFCHLVIFIPVYLLLTFYAAKFAISSIITKEHSWTSWAPPIYPLKTLMAIGFFMLFVQGVSSLLKDIAMLTSLNKHQIDKK